jgi:hypothetical protein
MKTMHSNKTEIGQYHDIAVLTDEICSIEVYENSVGACDFITVTELQLNEFYLFLQKC